MSSVSLSTRCQYLAPLSSSDWYPWALVDEHCVVDDVGKSAFEDAQGCIELTISRTRQAMPLLVR